ncbi:MAG: hypothetical protein ACM3U1_05510 [Chloroflexota bacterium]
MKTRLLTLYMAIIFIAPILCQAKDEWKVYPLYFENDTLSTINAITPLKEGGVLFSPWTKLRIIKDDTLIKLNNPSLKSDYYEIHRMQGDSKGTVWLNTLGGLANYTKEEGFQKVSKMDYGSTWDYGPLNGLTVDGNDNVWFLSDKPYLTKFDGEKFTDYAIGMNEFPYYPMPRLTAWNSSVMYDCPKGIVEFTPLPQDSFSLKITPLKEAKLTGKVMRCMQSDESGNLYAASDTNDLSIYTNGKWEAINIPDSLKEHYANWKHKFIKRIVPINDHQVYVFWATHYFFCKYDRMTNKWEKINFPFDINDTLNAVMIGTAEIDSDGYLWISTSYQGLLRYKPEPNAAVEDGNHYLDVWIERIYPNPTRGNVLRAKAFILPDRQDNITAYISDILGNKLVEIPDKISVDPSTGEANIECSLDGLANGAYIFVLKKGASVQVKNFVKIE